MTPAQISQKPPKEVKPKPTDRIAVMLPFSVRAKPGLVPPSGFFCLSPPPRLLASLFLRTEEVYVPARGARRGVSRANLTWVGGGWGEPERRGSAKGRASPQRPPPWPQVRCVLTGQIGHSSPDTAFWTGQAVGIVV